MADREKIFTSRRVTPPAGSAFRAVHTARRHHWPGAASLSMLLALTGLRYAIHNWHHPDNPSQRTLPLLSIAILLGAWNRLSGHAVNQEFLYLGV